MTCPAPQTERPRQAGGSGVWALTSPSSVQGSSARPAWVFYDGVFGTLIPDNLKAIVDGADSLSPRLNQVFTEYPQARGFPIDPARIRSPQD